MFHRGDDVGGAVRDDVIERAIGCALAKFASGVSAADREDIAQQIRLAVARTDKGTLQRVHDAGPSLKFSYSYGAAAHSIAGWFRAGFRRREAIRRYRVRVVERANACVPPTQAEAIINAEAGSRAAEALLRAFEALNPEERELICRRYADDQTVSAIAQSLGLTHRKADLRLQRLLSKLGELLSACGLTPSDVAHLLSNPGHIRAVLPCLEPQPQGRKEGRKEGRKVTTSSCAASRFVRVQPHRVQPVVRRRVARFIKCWTPSSASRPVGTEAVASSSSAGLVVS